MIRIPAGLNSIVLALAAAVPATAWAQQTSSPIERYRKLAFPPKEENFDKGWRERVALEFAVINDADAESLRSALRDENPFVRSVAARALGIRRDKASAETLAELAQADPEYFVRIRAIESLGFLKMKPEVIEWASEKDPAPGVPWVAQMAARQLRSETDFAAPVRDAFARGIQPDAIGSAKVGEPAPDFSALTTDGKPFRLSSVLGKKPIALYFAAFDG